MTIPLISALMRDYNDNAASCFSGGWARVRARKPLRGARVFRVKFFLRRCATERGYLLARPSCSCTPIQKGRTTGCRVNVISCYVFVPCPLGFTSMPIRDTLVVNPFLDEISCRAVISSGKGRLYRFIHRTNFEIAMLLLRFHSA